MSTLSPYLPPESEGDIVISGTHSGGKKAAQRNKERFDAQYAEYGGYYKYIASLGGKISRGGGFAANKQLAREAGRIGGLKSKPKN